MANTPGLGKPENTKKNFLSSCLSLSQSAKRAPKQRVTVTTTSEESSRTNGWIIKHWPQIQVSAPGSVSKCDVPRALNQKALSLQGQERQGEGVPRTSCSPLLSGGGGVQEGVAPGLQDLCCLGGSQRAHGFEHRNSTCDHLAFNATTSNETPTPMMTRISVTRTPAQENRNRS